MGLNDIVVYVDSSEATKARVGFAVALAKEHGAHLIGIAFAPTALLPLYGADVGFADMTEVMASVKTQGANALRAFEARANADGVSVEAELMQGMSEEFPHDFAHAAPPCRFGHSRPASRRRSADRSVCSGRALPVRFGPAGHHRAGADGQTVAEGHHRRGLGRQRGSRACDQRRADIPQARFPRGAGGGRHERTGRRTSAPNRRHDGASEAARGYGRRRCGSRPARGISAGCCCRRPRVWTPT